LTEVEQEHAQLIDFQSERMNRMEAEIKDLRVTLLTTMEMLTAFLKGQKIEVEFEDE